jgi:hypothetical protein
MQSENSDCEKLVEGARFFSKSIVNKREGREI